jgi:hypothetical protein
MRAIILAAVSGWIVCVTFGVLLGLADANQPWTDNGCAAHCQATRCWHLTWHGIPGERGDCTCCGDPTPGPTVGR